LNAITTCDFETEAILKRPHYPPKPVGVAIRWPHGKSEYLAWGHPDGNNVSKEEAHRALHMAWKGPVLFHNAAFDIEVAAAHFGMPWPLDYHDTLFQLFLQNPHAASLSLKPSAQRILGEAPSEQDALRDWIVGNVHGATKKNFGAHISLAPVDIVRPYAIGDVERTFALHQCLDYIRQLMPVPYNRERKLLPHLNAAERRGIRVDRSLLDRWARDYAAVLTACDAWIGGALAAPGLNVDSNDDLAAVMERRGLLRPAPGNGTSVAPFNPFSNGDEDDNNAVAPAPAKRSMSKPALQRDCTDPALLSMLLYRNALATYLRTFILPWLEWSAADGRIHPSWHQVRNPEGYGARTGRVASSDPNLTNVPTRDRAPPVPPAGLPALPELRCALLPEDGHVWVSADYKQQELRIAAHYEDGQMQRAYRRTPDLNLHKLASELIKQYAGIEVEHSKTKTIAFSSIYGAGLPKLAEQLGVTTDEASALREAYFTALPGLRVLSEEVKQQARRVGYVKGIGGRYITVPPPKIVKGRLRTYDYLMLNHLVQGSAAEQTKQAIVDYCAQYSSTFRAQCYDEINLSVPCGQEKHHIDVLTDCMINAIPLDVPMLVDVETGRSHGETTSWAG